MEKKEKKFDKHKYNSAYSDKNYSKTNLRFSKERDADIIEALKSKTSMTDYVRQCVRSDLELKQNKSIVPVLERMIEDANADGDKDGVEALQYCVNWFNRQTEK